MLTKCHKFALITKFLRNASVYPSGDKFYIFALSRLRRQVPGDNPLDQLLMSVINSAGIGKGRKSQGNVTYRYVRGRTLVSSRITENKSKTESQVLQRELFGMFGKVARLFAPFLNLSFDKTKYGSARNNFLKQNVPAFVPYVKSNGSVGTIGEGDSIVEYFLGMLQEANTPVVMGSGSNLVNASYSMDNKAATINVVTTEAVAVGDKIVVMFAGSYAMAGVPQMFDTARMIQIPVTEELIQALDDPRVFELDSSNVPELTDPYGLPVGATLDLDCAAVTILKMNGTQVVSRSYCQLLYEGSYAKTYTLSNVAKTTGLQFTVDIEGETSTEGFANGTMGMRENSSDSVATIISASAGSGKITLTCEAEGAGGGSIRDISLEEVASYIQLANGTRHTLTNRATCTSAI